MVIYKGKHVHFREHLKGGTEDVRGRLFWHRIPGARIYSGYGVILKLPKNGGEPSAFPIYVASRLPLLPSPTLILPYYKTILVPTLWGRLVQEVL